MFEQKNTMKKIISGIILACTLLLPCVNFASEHEGTQEKKQTRYDMAKKLVKGAAHGYGTFLSGTIAHEFGHWLVGKMIYKCNGFFYIHPGGSGRTYFYYEPTNKDIIKELLKRGYIKNYQPKLRLNHPRKHPLEAAAGPLFGIGYNLLAQRMSLQSYLSSNKQNFGMLCGALGAHHSLTVDILNLSPFGSNRYSDINNILQYFNIDCPQHGLADTAFQLLAVAASFALAWNIKAVLPTAAT